MPASLASPVPPHIEPYRVLEKIGEGGMGAVYKAVDTRLDRVVALKVLTAARGGNSSDERRFAREAKAAWALNHPNVEPSEYRDDLRIRAARRAGLHRDGIRPGHPAQ